MREKNHHGSTKFLFSAAVLMLAVCLCMWFPKTAHAMNRQSLSTPEQAEAFITLLLGENAASLDGVYDLTPDMEKAVSSSGGWAGLAKSLTVLGKPECIGPARADTWRGMNVLRVPCTRGKARSKSCPRRWSRSPE